MYRFRQLTQGELGHTLNRRQSVSPCGNWVVYDTRNDDGHIARNRRIEMVHATSGKVLILYDTGSDSEFGPGVGAAAFHPNEWKIIFIHGLTDCDATKPYGFARRFGAILKIEVEGGKPVRPLRMWKHAESRCCVNAPVWQFPYGCLSGGTHAHSWNSRGFLSFTYNDQRLENASKQDPKIQNLRTIGFMLSDAKARTSPMTDFLSHAGIHHAGEIFAGSHLAFLAATVKPNPEPDTDEISSAVDECWIGVEGYHCNDNAIKKNALAFLGTVQTTSGSPCPEVFVSDLPNENALVEVASGCGIGISQRRLTFTNDRKYPGVFGPRNWLSTSRDGARIYFLMRDDHGIVQLHFVPTNGGAVEQVTDLPLSIESQVSLDRRGLKATFLCDNRVVETNLFTGRSEWRSTTNPSMKLVGSVQALNDDQWICNAYVTSNSDDYLQIFVLE